MSFLSRRIAILLAAAALAPMAQAHAAAPACASGASTAVTVGSIAQVAAGGERNFAVTLGAGEGVFIDLSDSAPPASAEGERSTTDVAASVLAAAGLGGGAIQRAMTVCDATGKVLSPVAGDVFPKSSSLVALDDGQRLRFVAPAAGSYTITVASAENARELLVRRRELAAPGAVEQTSLDNTNSGVVSSTAPVNFSFQGAAGQWVELKATSDKDTVLRLAGPDRAGDYSVLSENDDSDGLNPMIRRRLPVTGTYYLQVDSLSEDAGEFSLTLRKIDAPAPPAPPAVLRVGATVNDRMVDSDDIKFYTLQVAAGRSYSLEVSAEYDAAVSVGLMSLLEADDGSSEPSASYAEMRAQDIGLTGTEKLTFTARANGQLVVKVWNFGTGDTDGAYTLVATDLGN